MGRPQNVNDPIVRVALRMPKEQHKALVAKAIKDERSLHSTILRMLRDGMAEEGKNDDGE